MHFLTKAFCCVPALAIRCGIRGNSSKGIGWLPKQMPQLLTKLCPPMNHYDPESDSSSWHSVFLSASFPCTALIPELGLPPVYLSRFSSRPPLAKRLRSFFSFLVYGDSSDLLIVPDCHWSLKP
jgi:hypothetical protein